MAAKFPVMETCGIGTVSDHTSIVSSFNSYSSKQEEKVVPKDHVGMQLICDHQYQYCTTCGKHYHFMYHVWHGKVPYEVSALTIYN